jgi:hypothetical protein
MPKQLPQSVKVRNFKYHDRYGTITIDGKWTPHTQQEVDDYREAHKDFIGCSEAHHIKMLESRIADRGGMLEGIITKGTQTSRLFQHTSTRDVSGQKVSIYCNWRDLERNEKQDMSCG